MLAAPRNGIVATKKKVYVMSDRNRPLRCQATKLWFRDTHEVSELKFVIILKALRILTFMTLIVNNDSCHGTKYHR